MYSGTALLHFERIDIQCDPTSQLRVALPGIIFMDSHIEHTDLSHQNDLGLGTGDSRIDKAPRQHPGMTSQQREYHHVELAALRLMDGGGIGKLDMAHFFHGMDHYKDIEDIPMVFGPRELSKILGISKNKTYEVVNRYDFPKIRVGRRIIISKKHFLEWMDGNFGKERNNT